MSPKKVDSKPERPERVYKRAAKAQRDLFRKSRRKRYVACDDVANGYKKILLHFQRVDSNSRNVRYYIFSIGTQNSYR